MASSASSSAPGASKFLGDLPSHGYFSSTVPSSNPGSMRVYICLHDTSPPEDQEIKTNQQNILIRSLMLKNSSSKDGKGVAAAESSRKRAGEKISDSRAKRAVQVRSTKVAMMHPGASSSATPSKDLQSLTVERLRALLKAKGLSLKGRKDDLIARLRSVDG
ncbi:uncharacterized protein LOC111811137 isoform X1 [Cucurbita pepo subsp. pepo]|uniref:uncharacterized protein LOC111811137 isoform X1 n=1 Tax=Cucurbita pepo subsp. pepo TaxID=3664 RepID=UPI000C9D54C1|nr:uncharacterized protein LOC111811137 isoform X1 [Cucurbita pepo subsp. pepo]